MNHQKKKSETPKSSVKSEHKSSVAYSDRGMAQAVLPLSRSISAISQGTVKSESISTISNRMKGMAQPVGITSNRSYNSVRSESRSRNSVASGMAQPVGIASSSNTVQTISSESSKRGRGRPKKQ